MGKFKKLKPSQIASKNDLAEDIEQTKFVQPKNRNQKVRPKKDEEEQFVDSNLSHKILKIARQQQRELQPTENASQSLPKHFTNLEESESEDEPENNIKDYTGFCENIQINQEDEEALKKFMSSDPKPRNTLADIIRGKLTEKKTELESHFSDADALQVKELDPNVVSVYEGCKEVLRRYRSGKIPKPFKALPKFRDWEQLLHLTDPQSWSAAAMYQATRIFSSNLNEHKVRKFYLWVLLPRIRDDLAEYKKLNFHLYQALVKALYKPIAFMTGIILPLLESGDCTLREAIIIGSIIEKYSIPALQSASAIIKIAEMNYTGANSIFLRIFLDKKYSLPLDVINAVHDHFMRFLSDEREMPVLWHQALLTFVQRYKSDLTFNQRDQLYSLLRRQYHPSISPEIERELSHAKCRS